MQTPHASQLVEVREGDSSAQQLASPSLAFPQLASPSLTFPLRPRSSPKLEEADMPQLPTVHDGNMDGGGGPQAARSQRAGVNPTTSRFSGGYLLEESDMPQLARLRSLARQQISALQQVHFNNVFDKTSLS